MSHKTRVRVALLLLFAVVAFGPVARAAEPPQQVPAPPVAARAPKLLEMHGDTRVDDYFWLRERGDPKVRAYLEAENAYTDAVMKPTEKLRARLYDEMVGRLRPEDAAPPVEDNGYLYWTRYEREKEYPIHCRKKAAAGAAEETVLDVNALATGEKLCKISGLTVSPDNRLAAVGVDTRGDRLYTIRIRDLGSGVLLPDAIPGTAADIAWAADSRTFFYTTRDASLRTYRVLRHVLGSAPASDVLVYQENDPTFEVSLRLSKSRVVVLVETSSEDSSEWRYLEATDPSGQFEVFQARTPGLRYWVDHAGGRFWIRTNLGAPNFRLMEASAGKTAKEAWTEVLPYRDNVLLEDFDAFRGYLVLAERANGLPRLRIVALGDRSERTVTFDDAAYEADLDENPEYGSRTFRFRYSSPTVPASIYDVELATGTKTLLKRDEVGGGYDPSRYEVRRIEAPTADGKRVPISLVFRKGLRLDGSAPLLLQGYGAYGNSRVYKPDFLPERLSLLDRGFVVGIAHVRGGQELGRAWYDDGKLQHKKNTFSDFIACAEHLVAQRYTSPDRLFANGLSAGGMLMAVVANWRPDLFRGIVAEVPWTDVVTDSLDPTLPLVTVEYQEWGDPNRKDDYEYLRSYSPYDNVKAQAYPALLVTGAFNDTQVAYWNPAKWVAKLRLMKTDSNPLLLVTNMTSGHSGASGRMEKYRLTALKYAFMLQLLGMAE
ncbi:MAG: S9 family peptidase [Thermoanaerobaculaceae bacterium]